MNKILAAVVCSSLLVLGPGQSISGQVKKEPADSSNTGHLKVIALNTADLESFVYDAGKAKFIVSSEDTNGAWSLVELTEMPRYHTNLHRHNHTSEAFYVLEGVLSVMLDGVTRDYPAGSYILVQPGTPHAQGNRGKVPVRLLLTMNPGGFERSFRDRAELYKTVKPDDPDFRKKRKENAAKGNYDVEFLADWDGQK
jgi:quercetin dioxygenase-like cupin family protein